MTGGIEQLQDEYRIRVRWRAFPLHPDTPEEGLPLKELFRTSQQRIDLLVSQLQATARQLGLAFGNRSHTYNSRLAQELGLWAEHKGHGRAFHQAAFSAYFVLGRNLADHGVLDELARQAGLIVQEAREILASRAWGDAVDRDWQLSRDLAISAVPTILMGDGRLVGAQSYQTLAGFMDQHGISRRRCAGPHSSPPDLLDS